MQVSKESIEAEDQPQINPDPSNETNEEDSGLAQFLIDRACKNSVIANYFYWYLMVEVDDQNENAIMQDTAKDRQMYKSVLQRFTNALKSGPQVSLQNVQSKSNMYSVWQLNVQILVLIVLPNSRFTFLWTGWMDFQNFNAGWSVWPCSMLNNFFFVSRIKDGLK